MFFFLPKAFLKKSVYIRSQLLLVVKGNFKEFSYQKQRYRRANLKNEAGKFRVDRIGVNACAEFFTRLIKSTLEEQSVREYTHVSEPFIAVTKV